jgi:hypothetical protein
MKKISDLIDEYGDTSLNFSGLQLLLLDIDVQVREFKVRVSGISAANKIFVNKNVTNLVPSNEFYYMLLHELGHHKRNIKYHTDERLFKLSKGDFESFFEFVISEEIIADRYARFCYYILNGRTTNISQNLHIPNNKEKYKENAEFLYDNLPDTLEEYNNNLTTFIV